MVMPVYTMYIENQSIYIYSISLYNRMESLKRGFKDFKERLAIISEILTVIKTACRCTSTMTCTR